MDFRRFAGLGEFQGDRGNRMGDRGAAIEADDESLFGLRDLHQRPMLELAGIVQRRFDEHDRLVRCQAVDASDLFVLGRHRLVPRTMRHQDGEFEELERIPQHA